MHNEKLDKVINNPGFNYALYLKSPNIRLKDQDIKNLKSNLELNNISLDEKLSKQFELVNCLSDDLLNKIEVGSPMKSINNDSLNILNLNLEERESDNKQEESSPSEKNLNKVYKINVKFDNEEVKNIPIFCPLNNEEKTEYSYSKNNFPMKKFYDNPSDSVGIQHFKENNNYLVNCVFKGNTNENSSNINSKLINNYNQNVPNYFNSTNNNTINQKKYDNIPSKINNYSQFNQPINQEIINSNINVYHPSKPLYNTPNANEIIFSNKLSFSNNDNNPNLFHKNGVSIQDNRKKKQFVDREGDWVCMRCKNKNFSFRILCNRCKLHKRDSEEMYNQHMKNLMNLVKLNEMMQTKIFNENCPNYINNVNSQGFQNFDPTLFSPNSCPIYDENCSDLYYINTSYTHKDNQSYPQN